MLRMSGGLRVGLVLLVTAGLVVGASASGGWAAGLDLGGGSAGTLDLTAISVAADPAASEVSDAMLVALQRDLKVTAVQARARLVRADWASHLDVPLRERLGRAYAGSWLAEDGHEFVVAVTDRRFEGLVRASG